MLDVAEDEDNELERKPVDWRKGVPANPQLDGSSGGYYCQSLGGEGEGGEFSINSQR